MLFFESPLLSLLHLPTYGSFFLQNLPSLLLPFCLSLSDISRPSLFFPPSVWLQPFSHPTSSQPCSAFWWSSDGPQVDFYLSVHEAPFLHLHPPNNIPSPPTPSSAGVERRTASCSLVTLYIFLLSANDQIYTRHLQAAEKLRDTSSIQHSGFFIVSDLLRFLDC